jgi:hypothetical protein
MRAEMTLVVGKWLLTSFTALQKCGRYRDQQRTCAGKKLSTTPSDSLFTMLQLTLLAAGHQIFHRKVFGTPFVAASGASSGRSVSMAQWCNNRQHQYHDGHSLHLTLH